MSKECENMYKVCRCTAGFTQERAAELLVVAPRTLSDYENGRANVPDDVVAKMAEIYKSPLLAWWHLRETSVLGKYIPDIVMPQTNGDMAFQLIIAEDELKTSVQEIKRIIAAGEIGGAESELFKNNIDILRNINAKLLSVVIYAEGLENGK